MKIIHTKSQLEAEKVVAEILLDQALNKPSCLIGLATGKTMVGVYKALVELSNESQYKELHFTMLDEYLGLSPQDKMSFRSYIEDLVMRPLHLSPEQFIFPPLIESAIQDFEKRLMDLGGVDLQLLGIGQNGHIGFNEPGSEKNSRTRVVNLTSETMKINKVSVNQAVSMGIGTIYEAKKIVMLATGSSKAEIIRYLVNHEDQKNTPATFLKSHPHFLLVLDPAAAAKINLNI